MRDHWLALAGVLILGPALLAQQAPPGAADAGQARLNAHLQRWEREMSGVQTIVAQCTRTEVNKTFQTTDVFEGEARYMKPNLAMLEMRKRGRPELVEKYVCSGTFLYEFKAANKQVRVHELPPPKPGQVADDNFLSFLFGMKADEARRRYDLTLAKEDQWYVYIRILPRFAADKQDFQEARLVLSGQTYLPRQLWFVQPNGDEVRWDIPKIDNGAALNRADFVQPPVPAGWNIVRVPKTTDVGAARGAQPRVIRQNQQ